MATTKVSLNIATLNLSSVNAVTIFFYLKIYGFTKTDTTGLILILGSGFSFYFDSTNLGLSLNYTNLRFFTYPNLIQSYFGQWIPVSLAMYRTTNSIFPPMNSMTVLSTTLQNLNPSANTSFLITELSISGKFIGLISDINLYKSFIINAFGFSQQ